jgi:hypothetical protein
MKQKKKGFMGQVKAITDLTGQADYADDTVFVIFVLLHQNSGT